jgi:hypothetical protein
MNINFDAGTLIASGITLLLSSAISFYIYSRQKNVEFRYDYRKYILDKRKVVYDMIEVLLAELINTKFDSFDNPQDRSIIFAGFRKRLMDIRSNDVWVNMRCQIALFDLKFFMDCMDGKISFVDSTKANEHWLQNGFENVRAFLISAYFHDITKLDRIDSFKKGKIKTYMRHHHDSLKRLSTISKK